MHSQAFANNALQAIILIEYILGIPQGLSPIFLVPDFPRGFQPEKYEQQYPVSSWREFVPCRSKNESAVWIEIRLSQIEENFVDGVALLSRWRSSGELYRKIMPLIECANVGPIGTSAFGEVLVYQKSSQCFKMVSSSNA
jgi:hypothetical protein